MILRVAGVLLMASLSVPAFADDLALAGGTCIDRRAVVTPDCVVVISGDRVVRSGSRTEVCPRRATRLIDVTGRWIVPGFVDNHVHLGRVTAEPEMWIRAGVTTLVENGSAVAPAEFSGRYASGPHLAACGPIITKTGGYPAFVEKDAPALQVSGAEDAARSTSAFIEREQPRCIKIAIERGFESDLSERGWPALTREEVEAIVKQARKRGLPVLAHVTQREEFDLAVDAGVDVIAHAPIGRVPDSSLRSALKRGVVIVSTVALWGNSEFRAAALDNLLRYVTLGGPIAIGSDYPNWKTGGLPIAELRVLSEAGVTDEELLVALTRQTVTKGTEAAADLVVLGSDPLRSLQALSDVELVIRGGAIVFEREKD